MQKISKFNVPTTRLNSKEYAIMLKAFNETYYSKNKSKSVCFVYTNIGYAYIVENMGYNTPRVLARKRIK